MFAYFNKAIFGYEEYLIKDQKLLNQADLQALASRNLNFSTAKVYFNIKDTSMQNCEYCSLGVCSVIAVCFVPNGSQPCQTCDAQCTYFAGYSPCWSSYVGTIFEQDPFVVEGDNGTGGLPSGWWEAPCEEDLSGNGREDPCDGLPGWEPVVAVGGGGGGYSTFGSAYFNNWNITLNDQIKIQYWKDHNNIDTIDFNADTLALDSCRREILRKLINETDSSSLGRLFVQLDKAAGLSPSIDKFKIQFFSEPLADNDAQTAHPFYDPSINTFEADIILDSLTALQATDLFIAANFIHEMIHAYMGYIWFKHHAGATIQQFNNLGYDQIFNNYVDTLLHIDSIGGNTYPLITNSYQHNYMANKLLDRMASILEAYDNSRIPDIRYYWYIIWVGLARKQVKVWYYLWPNWNGDTPIWPPTNPSPSEDSTRGLKYALTLSRIDSIYNKVISNEYTANPDAKGKRPIIGGCY